MILQVDWQGGGGREDAREGRVEVQTENQQIREREGRRWGNPSGDTVKDQRIKVVK